MNQRRRVIDLGDAAIVFAVLFVLAAMLCGAIGWAADYRAAEESWFALAGLACLGAVASLIAFVTERCQDLEQEP